MKNKNIFNLKRKISTYITFDLLENNLIMFEKQLNTYFSRSPNFLKYMPCIIDIKKIHFSEKIDFSYLKEILKKKKLILIGVSGVNEKRKCSIIKSNLSIIDNYLPKNKKKRIIYKTKIINRHIRSGEQIYEKESNLIILKPISSGAEVLSDGNIHIYSTLNGKALAGVNGNINARIFCNKIQSELIAIAGKFKLTEDIKGNIWGKPVMIFIENNIMKIKTF